MGKLVACEHMAAGTIVSLIGPACIFGGDLRCGIEPLRPGEAAMHAIGAIPRSMRAGHLIDAAELVVGIESGELVAPTLPTGVVMDVLRGQMKAAEGGLVVGGQWVALTSNDEENRAVARRLAACWNACRGLPIEVVERLAKDDEATAFIERHYAAIGEATPPEPARAIVEDGPIADGPGVIIWDQAEEPPEPLHSWRDRPPLL